MTPLNSNLSIIDQTLHKVYQGRNLIVSLPYGPLRMTLLKALLNDRLATRERILYVGTRKTTLDILRHEWAACFPQHRIRVFAGDYVPEHNAACRRDMAQVLLYTADKLAATLQFDPSHGLDSCRTIIVDAFDILATPRGPRLELALNKLLALGQPQVIALTTSTEIAPMVARLNALSLVDNSPVSPILIPLADDAAREQKLVDLIRQNTPGRVLVFTRTPGRARYLALRLCNKGYRAASHHSKLSTERQFAVEQAFAKGDLDIIVASSTLVGATYLGAPTVIVYDDEMFDANSAKCVRDECLLFKQIAHASERAFIFQSPSSSPMRPASQVLQSTLSDPDNLANLILRALPGEAANSDYLNNISTTELVRDQATEQLVESKLVTLQDGHLTLTPLGRIARQHHLSLKTATHWNSLVMDMNPFGFIDLLVLAALTPGFTPFFHVSQPRAKLLVQQINTTHSRLLQGELQTIADDLQTSPDHVLHAVKASLIGRDVLRGQPVRQIAARHQLYTAQIANLMARFGRLISAFTDLAHLHTDFSPISTAGRARALTYLLNGLPMQALPLTYLNVSADRLKVLGVKGYPTLTQLVEASGGLAPDLVPRAQALLNQYPADAYGPTGHIAEMPRAVLNID